MKLRNLFLAFLAAVLILSLFSSVSFAQESSEEKEVNVYFFWGEGCPHCEKEKLFLSKLEETYPDINIQSFEVTRNRENAKLLSEVGKSMNVTVSGVPFTVIGEHYFIGWYSEETTGKALEEAVNCAIETSCSDVVSGLVTPITKKEQPVAEKAIPEKISLPLIGDVSTKNISLPVLTLLIAAIDGFNPCAMWVLIFLISLLFGMKDKKKMWIFGSVFIAASAFVYFLFMSAWLNLFLFLRFIFLVRIIVGCVALWAAYYNLKEYFTNPAGVCKVTGEKKRQQVFEKLKNVIQQKHFALAILGLIALAFAVNLVELICSAGLPAVYTQILALSNLKTWQYYAYLVFYILVFMFDDMLVFFVAMKTLHLTGLPAKYARAAHLIGGIVMLVIGILMILKPELLMFG